MQYDNYDRFFLKRLYCFHRNKSNAFHIVFVSFLSAQCYLLQLNQSLGEKGGVICKFVNGSHVESLLLSFSFSFCHLCSSITRVLRFTHFSSLNLIVT